MKLIVLSLKNSKRREIIKKRLLDIGIDKYIIFDAVDGNKIKDNVLPMYFNTDGFVQRYGRGPAKGEIGCILSHLKIWNYIANSKHNDWLIIEDDAIVSSSLHIILNNKETLRDIIILGTVKKSRLSNCIYNFKLKMTNEIIFNKFKFGITNLKNIWGTIGYYIDKKACIKLTNCIKKPSIVADDWLYISNFVNVWHLKPTIIKEDFKRLKSDIEYERNLKKTTKQGMK